VERSSVVLVSYGEIGTKSTAVRAKMVQRLAENLAAVLEDRSVPGEVERRWARIVVHTDDPARAADAAADVPGVVWARPATLVAADLETILDAGRDLAAAHGDPDAPYAVRARRKGGDDAHEFTSHDLEREVGRVVGESTGAPVDLDDPDLTYRVEVREEEAFLSVRTVDGPGGLPVGTQDPVVALVSGGIDSPVAAHELLRRGAPVVPVYVDLGDYGGADHLARAEETVRTLAACAPNYDLRLRVVPAGDIVETLMEAVGHTRMLSLRRAMLRIAEAVAREIDAEGVVTGESLGQKSSQTAANLRVTDAAVSLPVHRPLLTRDKADIVERARAIGTYHDSTLPVGCERVAPSRPETRASLPAVLDAEPDDLLERAAAAAADARLLEP
jgi:thiamine biosynthesis protein ThiI